jgi:DNA recombination protein RmuC
LEIIHILFGLVLGVGASYLIFRFYLLSKLAETNQAFQTLEARFYAQQDYMNQLESENRLYQTKQEALTASLFQAEIKAKDYENKFQESLKQRQELEAKQEERFRSIANQVILNNSIHFSKNTSETLHTLLKPFGEKIDKFQLKIEETREKQIQDVTSLKTQISQLETLNYALSAEASNLTSALTGNSKIRGTWGEFILETFIQKMGLIKGIHYRTQTSLNNEDSERLQPDLILYLPENKNLVIDSKVSLVAYQKYDSTDEPNEKEKYLQEHIQSLQTHIKQLSKKNYQNLYEINSPDFVLIFIPIESSFTLAIQKSPELYEYAMERNIVLVTPSTMLATVKIISTLWKQENQNKNVIEIAKQSGLLYDKFVGFLEDMKKINQGLDSSKKAYDQAILKLTDGQGSLVSRTEKLKDLGARNTKQIPDLLR